MKGSYVHAPPTSVPVSNLRVQRRSTQGSVAAGAGLKGKKVKPHLFTFLRAPQTSLCLRLQIRGENPPNFDSVGQGGWRQESAFLTLAPDNVSAGRPQPTLRRHLAC